MSATPWMQEAWRLVGQSEVAGDHANAEIVKMFADAGVPELTSDETAWCGAFASACLGRAGLPIPTSSDGVRDRYAAVRANAFLGYGTPIEQPREGAIVVLGRGDNPREGHVGFVTGWDDRHIYVLGGNQANAVNVTPYPRGRLRGFRWPGQAVTAEQLAKAGSRTVKAAQQQKQDALGGIALPTIGQALPTPEASGIDPAAIAAKARETQGILETFADFWVFVWDKSPIIGVMIGAWFLVRVIRDADWIKRARAEDHNTGAHTGRTVPAREPVVQAVPGGVYVDVA